MSNIQIKMQCVHCGNTTGLLFSRQQVMEFLSAIDQHRNPIAVLEPATPVKQAQPAIPTYSEFKP